MDKWPGEFLDRRFRTILLAVFLVAGGLAQSVVKPCLKGLSLDYCPTQDATISNPVESRSRDVKTLNDVAHLLETQNTSICHLPYDATAAFYPPACCSFPFTLKSQLYTTCVSNISTEPPGCFLKPKVWVFCSLDQAGYQATEEVKTLVINGVAHYVSTLTNWITFQRRDDPAFNFHRPWFEYRNGFGNFTSNNFWLGLEKVYQLCRLGNCRLRIEIKTNQSAWFSEESDIFFLDNELGGYSLHHGPLQGDSGRLLTAYNPNGIANGQRFSTNDNDMDTKFSGNCAQTWRGGWWYSNCFWFNFNGGTNAGTGASGFSVNNGKDALAESRMMLKII